MKLMGLCINLPVADLRIPFDPAARYGFLSPYSAKLGEYRKLGNYLNGFGMAGERKLRIPWRQNETIYYRCHGAISLPDWLPDGAPVTQEPIRRLYLDDGPTIRFDLSVFTNPQHIGKSKGEPKEWILKFWKSNLKLREKRGHYKTASLADALMHLVSKFSNVSGPRNHSRPDLIRSLTPQIMMIVQAYQKELEPYIDTALKSVNNTQTLFIATEPQRLPGFSTPIPITFIIYHPVKFKSKDDRRFEQLRMTRALCAWLHTDIQILEELLRTVYIDPDCFPQLNSNIVEIADGLSGLSNACIEHDLQISLTDIVPDYVISRNQRLIKHLSPFGLDCQRIISALESHLKHKRIKSGPSLDDLIHMGIAIYKNCLDGKITPQRYDDSKFSKSAQKKAHRIFTRMPHTFQRAEPIFVSVGGADAAELFELMSLTSSSAGVLLEYADKSTDRARAQAKEKDVTLEIVTGDAMDKIDEAMNRAIELQMRTRGGPVIVTMMAVLHELPSRSKNFDLLTFFSKLRRADMIIGREPVEPINWNEYVLLEGDFTAELFANFSNLIVSGHFLRTTRSHRNEATLPNLEVQIISDNIVKGHKALIIETLTKAFYVEDLIYEIGERVTSFKPDDIKMTLKECFRGYSVDDEPLTSESINNYWIKYSLKAKNATPPYNPLGKPQSHYWFLATKEF